MAELESIFSKLLLSLQFCLAFWQIVKLTVFGALIKAFLSGCMSKLPCRLGTLLSPSYTRLKEFEDYHLFFFVKIGVCLCLATNEADQPTVASQVSLETEINLTYLGKDIHLERRDRHKLFVDGEMAYYITDPIWHSLLDLKRVDSQTVFLNCHKGLFRKSPIAGGLMDLPEVLDGLILRNDIIKPLKQGNLFPFIPIDLSVSEEKLLKGLNLVGLFLQSKKRVDWFIPTLLSFTSAVMEFCTPLRVWIYTYVNCIFCWAMHPLCDRLPLVVRLLIYMLLEWVENLKPSNDFQWRVVRGVKHAVIAGGAKACSETASLVHPSSEMEILPCVRLSEEGVHPRTVLLEFDANERKFSVIITNGSQKYTCLRDCEENKYKNMRTFIECLMKNESGSLESCDPNGEVCRVRSFRQSILCYIRNGFPQVYELELENGVIK